MKVSPVQLLDYTFEEVSVKASPEFEEAQSNANGEVVSKKDFVINVRTSLANGNETEDYFDALLRLDVKILSNGRQPTPYTAALTVRGAVRFHDKIIQDPEKADRRRSIAIVNGASLLYGVVREMFANMTARSANGLMTIPAMNFSDLPNQLKDVPPVELLSTNHQDNSESKQ